jgi:hypothetical protein
MGRRLAPVLAICAGLALMAIAANALAQDDWEAVPSGGPDNRIESAPNAAPKNQASAPSRHSDESMTECGEKALPAAPAVTAMVARINELWGSDVRVYESVGFAVPHAAPGGCIFYNPRGMAALMAERLDVNDRAVAGPLLWAIFAHEIGHEAHDDFGQSRASTPIETRELEADRFAGYTLEKLNIKATDLTPYWTMTGDEFGASAGDRHGSSAQRVAAFKEGWRLAEWNRPEDSQPVGAALDEPVAPDNPDSAPQ